MFIHNGYFLYVKIAAFYVPECLQFCYEDIPYVLSSILICWWPCFGRHWESYGLGASAQIASAATVFAHVCGLGVLHQNNVIVDEVINLKDAL